ncbi:LLM class flavin-dependent oxidoreductase [Leucobacter tardus]
MVMSDIAKLDDAVLTVGVALDGAGWDPNAWRDLPDPAAVFTAAYWTELVRTAERAGIDYVSLEDDLHLQGVSAISDGARSDVLQGRLDALLTLTAVAARTDRIGVIPVVTVTHTEPFHVATALQTLDHVSLGRAGWQLRISPSPVDAAAFGRRPPDTLTTDVLLGEAEDVAEVTRALWDSWEDDAVIRDVSTGRFLDRDRVHHVDFVGDQFSIAGPSIVPRSPQGQLPVTLLAETTETESLAIRVADVVFIAPSADSDATLARVRAVQGAARGAGRAERGLAPLRVVVDLEVDGARLATRGPGSFADLAAALQRAGADGIRLRPARLPRDLAWIAEALLPELRRRDLVAEPTTGSAAPAPTLRQRFGLPTAPNRYATARTADSGPSALRSSDPQEVHA